MVEYSLLCLQLVVRIVSSGQVSELDSFEWSTKDGEKRPILITIVQGENIRIPLREAPFCHLTETKKCNCFILKKSKDKSPWNVASFVKCDDKVRGSFMNSSDYFEIAPKEQGKSGQHIVKIHKPGNTSRKAFSKVPDEEKKEKPKEDSTRSKYVEPLREYQQLFENETGYLTVQFVVSKRLYNFESDVDVFLQNYVNEANQYIYRINLFIVHQGWIEAEASETDITINEVRQFIHFGRGKVYKKDRFVDGLILFGPATNTTQPYAGIHRQMCYGVPFGFVKYLDDQAPANRKLEVQSLIYILARKIDISHYEEIDCGKPPPGIIYIMEGATNRTGELAWANCSVVKLKKVKKHLACLRKKIKSSRSVCGNGIIEDGEECDCVADECKSCCNEDCRLAQNSAYSNGPCCDILKCQVFGTETQCRGSDDFCDIPELCDGISGTCPPDYVVANGYECNGTSGGKGYCYNGMCGSREDVCGWAFEDGRDAGDKCYDFNLAEGTDSGGCGPTFQQNEDGVSPKYTACDSADKLCGKIYCTQPEIGGKDKMTTTSQARPFFSFHKVLYSQIKNKSCSYIGLASNYHSLRYDPGFVQNGSVCGENLMCISQKCIPLPERCPENCNGEKIKHPYTGETFPAFVLEDSPWNGGTESSLTLLYLVIAIVLILILFSALYGLAKNLKIRNEKDNESNKTLEESSEGISPQGISKLFVTGEASPKIGRSNEASIFDSSKAQTSASSSPNKK